MPQVGEGTWGNIFTCRGKTLLDVQNSHLGLFRPRKGGFGHVWMWDVVMWLLRTRCAFALCPMVPIASLEGSSPAPTSTPRFLSPTLEL